MFSGDDCNLVLDQFKYIGLYELLPDLLEKLSEAGFISADFIKNPQPGRINPGTQSHEDTISHEQALDWLMKFPSDFVIWTILYERIMKQKYGRRQN